MNANVLKEMIELVCMFFLGYLFCNECKFFKKIKKNPKKLKSLKNPKNKNIEINSPKMILGTIRTQRKC